MKPKKQIKQPTKIDIINELSKKFSGTTFYILQHKSAGPHHEIYKVAFVEQGQAKLAEIRNPYYHRHGLDVHAILRHPRCQGWIKPHVSTMDTALLRRMLNGEVPDNLQTLEFPGKIEIRW